MIQNNKQWGGELHFEDGRWTLSTARNGRYRCTGVDLYASGSSFTLTGITSKKEAVSGSLIIPIAHIPEFIELLQETLNRRLK